MKRLNGLLILATVALLFSGCQRKNTNADYQANMKTVTAQMATMISNAKQGRAISKARGTASYDSMSACYGNTCLNGDVLSSADRCYTYIASMVNQLAAGQITGDGKYEQAMATLIQCQMGIAQQNSMWGTAAFRAADSSAQQYLTYSYNWPQYGSLNTYGGIYSQGGYSYLNNLGYYGSLTNQSGTSGYQYPYTNGMTSYSGSLQNYY